MDLSKSINAFVQVVIWICQNWYMDFSVVGLGRLCHWQCFVLIRHDSWGYNRSKLPDTIFWTILTLKTQKTYNCTWCLQHLHAQRRAGTFSPFKFGLHLSRGFSYFQITYILVFGKQPPKNMTKKSVVNNDTQKSYCSSQPSMVNWLSSSIFSSSVGRSFVPPAMVTSDKISNLFNINWHKSHIITQYHLIPSNAKLN